MKLYFDTSVYGGYYDDVFRDDTRDLFDYINERNETITIFLSKIVKDELSFPREPLKSKLLNTFTLIKNLNLYPFTMEMEELAHYYILSNVIHPKCYDDARHIAFASMHKVDYIISWNFKHMVNRETEFSTVNLLLEEKSIKICSPSQFLENVKKS